MLRASAFFLDESHCDVTAGWTALLHAASARSSIEVVDYLLARSVSDQNARLVDALLLLGAEHIDHSDDYTKALECWRRALGERSRSGFRNHTNKADPCSQLSEVRSE